MPYLVRECRVALASCLDAAEAGIRSGLAIVTGSVAANDHHHEVGTGPVSQSGSILPGTGPTQVPVAPPITEAGAYVAVVVIEPGEDGKPTDGDLRVCLGVPQRAVGVPHSSVGGTADALISACLVGGCLGEAPAQSDVCLRGRRQWGQGSESSSDEKCLC